MINRHLRAVALVAGVALVGAALPACAPAQSTVKLLGYQTTVPAGWTPRAPASSMRLAEYTIAPQGNAGSAEVVVYFFGAGQGGGVAANLDRWRGQFSEPDGSAVPELVTRDTSAGFPITFADFRGTYRRGFGAGSADSVKTNQELVAAIAETPRGTLFVQMFGPIDRVTAERPTFFKFVKGLR